MAFNEDFKAQPTNTRSQTPYLSSTATIRSHSNNSATGGSSSATLPNMTQDASGNPDSNTLQHVKEDVAIDSDSGEGESVNVNNEISIVIQNQTFHIDRESLEAKSGYFKRAFRVSSCWLEGLTGTVELECDLTAFKIFKSWVEIGSFDWDTCSGNWFAPSSARQARVLLGNKQQITHSVIAPSLDSFVECYILGDYLDAPDFENEIMHKLSELYAKIYYDNYQIPLHNLSYIWCNTSGRSLLRIFVMDAVQSCLSKNTLLLAGDRGLIPDGLALAMAAEGLERVERTLPWNKFLCVYHVHPTRESNGVNADEGGCSGLSGAWDEGWDTATEDLTIRHSW